MLVELLTPLFVILFLFFLNKAIVFRPRAEIVNI